MFGNKFMKSSPFERALLERRLGLRNRRLLTPVSLGCNRKIQCLIHGIEIFPRHDVWGGETS